jgi:hypothetical protein
MKPKAKKLRADAPPELGSAAINTGYEKDPAVAAPPVNPQATLEKAAEAAGIPPAPALPAKDRKPREDTLSNPLPYVIDSNAAIEKVENLLEQIGEARPDLRTSVDQLLEEVDALEQKSLGDAYGRQEAEEAQPGVYDQKSPEQSQYKAGDKVIVRTEQGDVEGTVMDLKENGTFRINTPQNMVLDNVPADSMQPMPDKDISMMLPAAKVTASPRGDAERLMVRFSQTLDALEAKHGLTEMHRGVMDEYKPELMEAIKAFAGEKKYDQEVYDALEEENYHFLNQALQELGLFEGADAVTAKRKITAKARISRENKVLAVRKLRIKASKKVKALGFKADFMQKQVYESDGAKVELKDGSTEYLPADVYGDGKQEPTVENVAQFCEGEPESVEKIHGWWGRYSAPGYTDRTDWVFDEDKATMEAELERLYGNDDAEEVPGGSEEPPVKASKVKSGKPGRIKADGEVQPYSDQDKVALRQQISAFLDKSDLDQPTIDRIADALYQAELKASTSNEMFTDFDWMEIVKKELGVNWEGPFKDSKVTAGIRRLPSGRWADTNGNSYDTREEAAEAEGHGHMDPKADPESEEYKQAHKQAVEDLLGSADVVIVAGASSDGLRDSIKAGVSPEQYISKNWDELDEFAKVALLSVGGDREMWNAGTPEDRKAVVMRALEATGQEAAEAEEAPDLKASAFDKLEDIDLGGGMKARKKKGKAEGSDKEEAQIEIVDSEGKVVDTYPDAFGDDSVSIIKFFRKVLDIKEGDDKTAAKKDEKGGEEKPKEGPPASDKPQGLPAVDEKKKAEEKEQMEASRRQFEAHLGMARFTAAALLRKGHITASQVVIDTLLLEKKSLPEAQEAAGNMAIEAKVLELVAMTHEKLSVLHASLDRLDAVKVTASSQQSGGLPIGVYASLASVSAAAVENAPGLGAAFGVGAKRR